MICVLTCVDRVGVWLGIASGFDFADEDPLPVAGLFHRLDRALFARFHPWNREVVGRHAVPLAAPHHVEPQVLEALASVGAAPFVAAFSDRHGSSSFMLRSFRWLRDSCWCTATDPVLDIARDESVGFLDAESLRDEQTAQVRASNRFLVTADELGDFERGHESSGESIVCEDAVDLGCASRSTVLRIWYAFFLIGPSAKPGRRIVSGADKNGNQITSRWVPR